MRYAASRMVHHQGGQVKPARKSTELLAAEKELRFWRPVAKALGMRVSGWTYTHEATFVRPVGDSFHCPGDVAVAIRALLKAARTTKEPT